MFSCVMCVGIRIQKVATQFQCYEFVPLIEYIISESIQNANLIFNLSLSLHGKENNHHKIWNYWVLVCRTKRKCTFAELKSGSVTNQIKMGNSIPKWGIMRLKNRMNICVLHNGDYDYRKWSLSNSCWVFSSRDLTMFGFRI